MKKRSLILFLSLMMTGCTQIQPDLKYETMSEHVQTESTVELITEFESSKEGFSFKVRENIVEVIKDHEVLQTLECDWPANEDSIIIDDFDFDGNDDIFVRMEHGAMYAPGTYFRYHPETSQYKKWDTLNFFGRAMLVDHEKKTLMYREYDSGYWLEYYVYEWNEGSLVLIEHMISDNGKVFETLPID